MKIKNTLYTLFGILPFTLNLYYFWGSLQDVIKRIDYTALQGHQLSVNTLMWSNYNNWLVSAGDDKKIMVWDIQP
jgi:WD40 repeat protein